MIKRYLKICLPIILVICIIASVWIVTDPNFKNIGHDDPLIVPNPINTIKFEDINDTEYGISNMIKIDDENYIIVTRKLVVYENNDTTSGIYENKYNLYKYNINTGIQGQGLQIDEYFEIAGIDIEQQKLYLAVTDLKIPQGSTESKYNIAKVNYETMQIEDTLTEKTDFYNCYIADNMWVYLVNGSIYVSNKDFANERVILERDNHYMYSIYDVVGDKIIYSQYSEGKQTIGIIDINGNNTILQDVGKMYICFNETTNEMYYVESNTLNTLMKINVNTLEREKVLDVTLTENEMFSNVYMLNDMNYVVTLKIEVLPGRQNATLQLYDLNTKNMVSEHSLENTTSIASVQLVNDTIIFVQNDKLYEWNYMTEK